MLLVPALLIMTEKGSLRDGKKNRGTGAKRTHEIASNGEETNDCTSECRSSWDDTLELLVHGLFTMSGHDKSLFFQLLGYVSWCRAADLNPRLAEQGASACLISTLSNIQSLLELTRQSYRRGKWPCG
jgi:hypothetical protein